MVWAELPTASRDLLDAAHVAVLATVNPDGRPQLTAVWYLFEGGDVKLTIRGDRKKLRNLMERPAATLFFLDPANPLRTLEVRGSAEISLDDGYAFADRIGGEYGTDLRSMDQPGDRRFVVTLLPDRVTYRTPNDRVTYGTS